MSSMEVQILELIQGLTLAQQVEALNHALVLLVAKQEKSPAPSQTSD